MGYYWWNLYKDMRTHEWERNHSALIKQNESATYDDCRRYACEDISSKTWCDINENAMVVEIPKGQSWHLIGRVATTSGYPNTPEEYYGAFENRDFMSFSTISNKNISRYKGRVFYIYNILPEDIVHVFPMDSDLDKKATSEENLCGLPSLWIGLDELECMTNGFKTYDQITCKTKRNGEIIKPIAVASFDELNKDSLEISKRFGIPSLICHPDKDAINYTRDALFDGYLLERASRVLSEKYGINVQCMEYWS